MKYNDCISQSFKRYFTSPIDTGVEIPINKIGHAQRYEKQKYGQLCKSNNKLCIKYY